MAEEIFDETVANNVFKEEAFKANKELSILEIISDKYKNIIIDGVSVPSTILATSAEQPYVIKEPRNVSDITEDEDQWLKTNMNFILYDNGNFITVTSGNQLAFYQTLLRIKYYCYVHNIPIEYFHEERYYKLINILNLINSKEHNINYKPKFKIHLEINMRSHVKNKNHGFIKFNSFVYGTIKPELVNYSKLKDNKSEIELKGYLEFDNINELSNYFSDLLEVDIPSHNNIFKMFQKFNPIYLNHLCKTDDTFGFFANPKAWLVSYRLESGPACNVNLIIKPVFIDDNINLVTWHNNVKDIEIQMEYLSNKIKNTCDKFIFIEK